MTVNDHGLSVHIRVHTHSAKKDDKKCPGVTLRDIRLAYLLEKRFQEGLVAQGGRHDEGRKS